MPDPLADLAAPDASQRLRALAALRERHTRPEPRGTNTHVHTNYSFSAFRSPAEAAWLAWREGVEIFGINDHYTVDGHEEFARACAALDLPATFSIEAVAMDRAAAAAGTLLNDPGNPGRTYLCGKGVTARDDPRASERLRELRAQQETRNRAMVAACDARFVERLDDTGPTWDDIVAQTPAGNTTERHIARACVERCRALATTGKRSFGAVFADLTDTEAPDDDAAAQNQLRSALLKAGKPCYVDEDPAAYPSIAGMCALYRDLGAIPTYPVLGNPVTDGERDIAALCDRLGAQGIFALELIPSRNTDDRVAAVLAEAERRDWPVFDGTEHNTPAMSELLPPLSRDPRFRPVFRAGALLLLGHQALCAAGEPGYLDADGQPRSEGRSQCIAAGERVLAGTTG